MTQTLRLKSIDFSGAGTEIIEASIYEAGNISRVVNGRLTAGDTVTIYGALEDDPAMYTQIMAFSGTPFGGTINGPWKFFKIEYAGVNGGGRVCITV